MPPENDDLRTALEEAFNEVEGQQSSASPEERGSTAHAEEPVRTAAPTERSEPVGGDKPTDQPADAGERGPDGKFLPQKSKEGAASPSGQPGDVVKPDPSVERAPESWKPAAREFWQKLPVEARQEIQRREQDIAHFVQQTAAKRKMADGFMEVVQPYMGMIQSEGGNPFSAIQNLFATAQFLRTGPSGQKAQMIAKLVKDYGVSIEDLDRALVGEAVPDRPEDKISQLIEQRLAPVNQFIEQVQGVRQQRSQQVDQEVDNEIVAFAQDPANEFFKDVYNEMADLVEMAARRNQSLSLKDAYDKACQLNPQVQQAIQRREQSKRNASSSVALRGAPSNASAGSRGDDIRSDLESAFERLATR